jgi:hypothetical protein
MANIYLSPPAKWWINIIGTGVWGTGVGWLVAHYLLRVPGDFGIPTHPAEPWWLRVHGAFAFLAIWTGGMLWGVHVVKAWREHRHRWSGGFLLGLLLLLITTGFLLYYVGSDEVRVVVSKTHWITGLTLPLLYLLHRIAKKKRRRTLRHSELL